MLRQLFWPNQAISKRTATILIVTQITICMLVWFFSPFVFLPTPSEVYGSFIDLWRGGLGGELIVSFGLNLEAIAIATALSLGLAYLDVIPFFRPFVAALSKFRFVSLVGLTFFFMLIAKSGHQLKLYLLVFSISVFFLTSMADVLVSIPKTQFDLARTLRFGEWRVLWEVIIIGQADKAFDVLRQNAAIGWLMLTMVEGMSRSEGGIGALLMNQNKHFHLSAVFAIQLTILAIGLLQDYVIGVIKKVFCPYAGLNMERK
jgi:NitT/TauT family transport system permease protein